MLQRLTNLEKRYIALKRMFGGVVTLLIFGMVGFGFTKMHTFDIIRAKGIIIEDESGKDRILIGAPIPFSKDRVRTDSSLVRKYWASKIFPKNPDRFMEFYKTYDHSTNGMVVMNEAGFDRVLFGDQLADSNTGDRNFEAAGITWNDRLGFEMGGAGVNTGEDGKARGVIGLDDARGEALHLVVLEDGTKALIIGGANGRLMIGMSDKDGQWFQNSEKFAGVKFFDNNGSLVWDQQMNSLNKK